MPLEDATTIEGLDKTWPLGGDPHNKGDDHLRLIKAVLEAQFPGAAGGGFSIAITASEQELNWLGGLTSNVQDQLDALGDSIGGLLGVLSAPQGTRMLFYQATPPAGWILDATITDTRMLRVVSVSGGGKAGTDNPILNDKVPLHNHTSAVAGAHSHSYDAFAFGGAYYNVEVKDGPLVEIRTQATSSTGSHSHTINNNAGADTWQPRYIDMVVGVKT